MSAGSAATLVRFRCRRLGALAVLALALTWPATVLSQDNSTTCTGGIEGIEASGVCCISACLTCGGDGCGNIEGTSDEECCIKAIRDNSVSCTLSGEAPCIIDTSPTATPTTSPPIGAPQLLQPTVLPTPSITKPLLNATPNPTITTPTANPDSTPTTTRIPSTSPIPSLTLAPTIALTPSPTVTPVLILSPTPVPTAVTPPTTAMTPVPLEAPSLPPSPPSLPIPAPTPTQEPSSPSPQTPLPTTSFPTTSPPSSAPPTVTAIPTPMTSLPTAFPSSSIPTVTAIPMPVPTNDPQPEDSVCSNGMPGYQNSVVCCPVECGQCGGSGCENILETNDTQWHCCSDLVIIEGEFCDETGEAPCITGTAIMTHVGGDLSGAALFVIVIVIATRVWWFGP